MTRQSPSSNRKLVCVAAIRGAHGVRGDVRLRSFTDDPAACFDYGPLLDENGNVFLTPKRTKPIKEGFAVTPETLRQKEEWDALKGTLLFVDREALPEPEENEVYFDDLIGMTARLEDGRVFGTVRGVHNFGSDDLLDVQILPDMGKGSLFLPFTKAVVPELDVPGGLLTVDLSAAGFTEADLQGQTSQKDV